MISVSSIALSGLHAATRRLDGAAHRIANLQTPGFAERSAATLEQDVVTQIEAGITYRANLGVIRTEDAMLGRLLDLRA